MADINRYLNLITSEHSDRPKFRATVTAALNKADIGIDFVDAFDIDTAVGVQLDLIGAVLGLDRKLSFQPTDGSSSILADGDYRSLLKAKIVLNQWDGTMETLTDALARWNASIYFVIKDNQDMTMDVIAMGTNQLQKELIVNGYVVPKPAGVKINYSMSTTALFAYDSITSTLAGYDSGSWL